MQKTKKPCTISKGTKLGQAPALPIRLWNLWLEWLLENAGPRIYLVVYLTGSFGLRTGEALALKRENLGLNASIPKITVTPPATLSYCV